MVKIWETEIRTWEIKRRDNDTKRMNELCFGKCQDAMFIMQRALGASHKFGRLFLSLIFTCMSILPACAYLVSISPAHLDVFEIESQNWGKW